MTEDYKKKLLAYLCGKYETETGNDEPQFLDTKEYATNLDTQLKAILTSYTIRERQAFQAKDAKGNLIDKYYIYGTHGTSSARRGFIAVLDKKFNLLKCITKFTSDVEIGPIASINVDEEGYVSIVETNIENDKRRFIMLNNIAVKLPTQDYTAKIRRAYNLQDPIQTTDASINFIFKKSGEAVYAFVAWLTSNTFVVQTLQVQVSSENVWKNYTYSITSDESIDFINFANCWWESDKFDFYIVGQPKATVGSNNAKIGVLTNYENSDTISYKEISLKDVFNPIAVFSSNAIFVNNNTIFLGTVEKASSQKKTVFSIIKINFFGDSVTLVNKQTFTHATTDPTDFSIIKFQVINSETMYMLYHIEEGKDTSDIQIGRLVDLGNNQVNVYNKELGLELADSVLFVYNAFFFVSKEFNLYNYLINYLDEAYSNQQIYNYTNYNGLPYQALNSLVPNSSILYNSQNEPIFARNLYNKTISGRMTNSTVEVPNNFLNDDIIAKENLIGKTNSILVDNQDTITKNIYETLNINFLTSISIKDENNPDDVKLRTEAAVRLNNSVSETNDYDLTKCVKVEAIHDNDKITYVSITDENIQKITDTMYMYEFIVYNGRPDTIINELIFWSADNKTDYLYVENLNLEYGKFYKITQFVEII